MLPLLGLRKSSFHLIVHSLSSCIRHRCHRRYSIIIKTRFPSFLRLLFIIPFPSTDKLRLAIEIRNVRHYTFFVWHPLNKDRMTARGRRDGEVKLTPVSVCPLFLFPSLSYSSYTIPCSMSFIEPALPSSSCSYSSSSMLLFLLPCPFAPCNASTPPSSCCCHS